MVSGGRQAQEQAKDIEALFSAAVLARTHAYAPYSSFAVGAALRSASGAIFTGCNVENAAYPSGTCAEQAAISAMIGAGETRIAEIAVIGDADRPVTPCGACRQRIREFAMADTQIHAGTLAGARLHLTMGELLPHAFGPDVLSGHVNS